MSHITEIDLRIDHLRALKKAAQRLGGQLIENCHEFQGYSKGKSLHKIVFPNASFEVGIAQDQDGGYSLHWDQWSSGGLQQAIGSEAGLLKQAYAVERSRAQAEEEGLLFQEEQLENGVIELTMEGGWE